MEDRSLYIQRESYGLNKQVIKGLEREREREITIQGLHFSIDRSLGKQLERQSDITIQDFREMDKEKDRVMGLGVQRERKTERY